MSDDRDLFGEPLDPRKAPPEALTPPQWRALEDWAEARVPWISRGALGSMLPLAWHVEQALDWGRANGRRRPSWPATCRNWIRKAEAERLARMRSPEVGLALRDPARWAREFDARHRVLRSAASNAPQEVLRPEGATVHRLVPRSRG